MTTVRCTTCGQVREMAAGARAMPRHQFRGEDCVGSGTGRFSEVVTRRPEPRAAVGGDRKPKERGKNARVQLPRYECPICSRDLGQGPIRKVRRHRRADGKICSGSGELQATKVTTTGGGLTQSLVKLGGAHIRVVRGGLPGLGKRR